MAASNHLWTLIKRLDKADIERFRKVYANPKDEKAHYVLLFEDLLKVNTYKENDFKAQNHGKPYMHSLPQLKRYLYDQVLDVLRETKKHGKDEKPPEFIIRELVEEAIILRNLMLFDQSMARLEKAEESAKAQQFLELLLEILKLKRTQHNEAPTKEYKTAFPKLLLEIEEVGRAIALNCKMIAVRDAVFFAHRLGLDHDDDSLVGVQEAKRELIQMPLPRSASIELRINYHVAKALYGHWTNDVLLAWRHYRAVFLLWRADSAFRNARRGLYLKTLNNYLTTGIAARKDADFVEAFDILEKSVGVSSDERAEAKQNSAYTRLQYYLSTCDWDNCSRMEEEFKQKHSWVTVKMQQSRLLAFYLSFARFYFAIGDHGRSAKYVSHVLAEPDKKHFPNRLADAKVLELLNEIEQSNQSLPENAVRNMDRFFTRHGIVSPFYRAFLNLVGSVFGKPEPERKELWASGRASLRKQGSHFPFDGGEHLLTKWVEAKARGSSVKELLESDEASL